MAAVQDGEIRGSDARYILHVLRPESAMSRIANLGVSDVGMSLPATVGSRTILCHVAVFDLERTDV
jgi:hypothetical protein